MILPAGKLPLAELRAALQNAPQTDPAVVVGAAPGEDAAAIDVGAPELLVAASDPITFATADVGAYLLAVNGNDLAVMGAEPRWLLATVLAPEGSTTGQVRALIADVAAACAQAGVALVGGHTEVTPSVRAPIVAGTLLGAAPRHALVRSSGAKPGDALILAGPLAVEGAVILARDHAAALLAAGVSRRDVEAAAGWLASPGISVRPAAAALLGAGGVHAMHDPTEGGLLAALHELAEASGVGLDVDRAAAPVLPACCRICRALGVDPYKLLASGALLASVSDARAAAAAAALGAAGIAGAVIGRVTPAGEGRRWTIDGSSAPLPPVDRDELARVLSDRGV